MPAKWASAAVKANGASGHAADAGANGAGKALDPVDYAVISQALIAAAKAK